MDEDKKARTLCHGDYVVPHNTDCPIPDLEDLYEDYRAATRGSADLGGLEGLEVVIDGCLDSEGAGKYLVKWCHYCGADARVADDLDEYLESLPKEDRPQ